MVIQNNVKSDSTKQLSKRDNSAIKKLTNNNRPKAVSFKINAVDLEH